MSGALLDPSLANAIDGAVAIAVQSADAAGRFTGLHAHARGQLLGALRGLLSVSAAQGQWIVPAIHAIWIPPGQPHGLRSHGPFSGWSVYVAPHACGSLPQQPCTLRVGGLLREAVARASGWAAGPLDEARARIAGVIVDEIRSAPRESFGLPMPSDPRLLRVAQALAEAPSDGRSLDEWAAWGAVAPRTLMRRFVAETGFTFAQWRSRARLMRALELLAGGASVTSTALELGYESVSAFIALFRRSFGITPAGYRRDGCLPPPGQEAPPGR